MTNRSYQNEIPKARVNIKLDVETGGASLHQELPHKTLVMGNFSGHTPQPPLNERNAKPVSIHTIDAQMAQIKPSVSLHFDNEGVTQKLALEFKSMKDFHPDNIVKNQPMLQQFVAMRRLIVDLRAQLMDNPACKEQLLSRLKQLGDSQ